MRSSFPGDGAGGASRFAAGALSALAQPPFFAFPLLWLTFPILVWLIDGAVASSRSGRVRRLAPAFATGWWFGFGYFLAGLWWIGSAFLVEADKFGWLMPFAVVLVPAGLALFWGFGAALAQLLWSEDWRRIFALALGLGAAEWARGTILTGFPWNSIGYALTAGEVLMQSASLFGLHALNVIAVVIFAAPATLAPVAPGRKRNVALPALALAGLAGLGLYGFIRLSQSEAAFVPDVTIRIAQPALDQLQKWDPANKDAVLETYIGSERAGGRAARARHHPGLAGIVLPLCADRGARRARRDRRDAAGEYDAGDRRLSRRISAHGRAQGLQLDLRHRRGRRHHRRLRQGASGAVRRIRAPHRQASVPRHCDNSPTAASRPAIGGAPCSFPMRRRSLR